MFHLISSTFKFSKFLKLDEIKLKKGEFKRKKNKKKKERKTEKEKERNGGRKETAMH